MPKVAIVFIGLALAVGGCGGSSKPLWEWEKNEAAAKKFKCSDLTEGRWEKLRAMKPPPRALTGFAMKLRACKTLVGKSRKDLYGFLGKPDRSGKKYASWVVGYDRMFGDELALTAAFSEGKVKYIEPV